MLAMGTTWSSLGWKIVSNVTDSPVANVRMNVYHVLLDVLIQVNHLVAVYGSFLSIDPHVLMQYIQILNIKMMNRGVIFQRRWI